MTIEAKALPAPADGGAPLVAGTIQGVRAWGLVVDGGTGRDFLGALGRDVIWPRGGAMRAVCVPGGLPGDHSAPDPHCSCGIYAHHPCATSRSFTHPMDYENAVGVIDAWGRVEVHEVGFRAEFARPAALLVDSTEDEGYRRRLARVAADYGIPAIELAGPEAFDRFVASEINGLSEEAIEQLVLGDRELLLEPEAMGYVTQRGRAIGGFGYALEEQGDEPSPWKVEIDTERRGVMIVRVAGPSYRSAALQNGAFDPGRELRLVPEPTNLQDRNAIAIWDERLRWQVGYVPRALAPEVGRHLAGGRVGRVMGLWEWRDLRTGSRFGLHILISQTPNVRIVDPRQEELPAIEPWCASSPGGPSA